MKKKIKGKKKTERRKEGMLIMNMMFVMSELLCQYYDYKKD